jgi:hypothetical protein
MLGHIFYFFGLLVFILSLNRIFQYFKLIEIKEWLVAFKKVTQRDPVKTDFRSVKDYNLFVSFGCLSMFETLWIILGFMSSNWLIFLVLFLSGFILKQILYFTSFNIQKVVGLIFTTTKSLVILILVINHFHFHQDLVTLIFNWF